jgi:hypothetical protein
LKYQATLIVNDGKKPFVVQCDKAVDLNHLVSAMEFWIKSAENGKAVPLASMPYSNQGLRLNNASEITALWADSPAGKTGLKWGDIVWSLDENPANPQNKTNLEKVLSALSPGDHTLNTLTTADWQKAKNDYYNGSGKVFNPLRTAVKMSVPLF